MHDHHPPHGMGWREKYHLLINLARIASEGVTPWLRKPGTAGERYFGGHAMLGLVWMFCCIGLGGGRYAQPAALWACGLTCAWLVVHRLRHRELVARGYRCHSLYGGEPWLPGKREHDVKQGAEPTFLMLLGLVAYGLAPGLGGYLLLAGVGHGLATAHDLAAFQAQVRATRDARIAQEVLQHELRKEE